MSCCLLGVWQTGAALGPRFARPILRAANHVKAGQGGLRALLCYLSLVRTGDTTAPGPEPGCQDSEYHLHVVSCTLLCQRHARMAGGLGMASQPQSFAGRT